MNAESKKLWLTALRSGKYLQGRNLLRSGDRFCCLGVLCDVLQIPSEVGNDVVRTYSYGRQHWTNYLPEEVKIEQGIDLEAEGRLTRMNDTGTTFNKIADWIEDNL